MTKSVQRYFQCLVFFAFCVFIFGQGETNGFYNPLPISMNSYQRPGATRKSTIRNDISNYGQFSFKARYNHNQVEIEGMLYDHLNGTKELILTGLARVILISKGFSTNSNGYFHTFDNYDQIENQYECPSIPSVPNIPAGAFGAGPSLKTVHTILG